MLRRLGQFCYDHRKSVVAAWIVAFVSFGALSGIIGPGYDSSFEIPASDSRQGIDVLNAHFEGQGSGFGGSIVFAAEQGVEDPEVQAAMEELFAAVDEIEGVSVTSPYSPEGAQQIAAAGPRGGQVAFASVDLTSDIDQTESAEIGAEIVDMLPEVDGLRIEVGGAALGEFEPPESELIGLAFAIVVLILAFGSVLAMGIPVGMAVSGVGIGIALVTLLSNVMTMPDFATTIGAMIGLGVGIDYALFVVSRYRETTRLGLSPRDAIAVAMDTAGRAVMFAGLTVVISLLGMLIIGLPFISGLGIGAAVTVTVTMIASVTLLPALLGLFASRLELTRWRGLIAAGLVAVALLGLGLGQPALVLALPLAVVVLVVGSFWAPLKREVPRRPERPVRESFWYKWSRIVQRHPWRSAISGVLVLVLLAWPFLSLRLGFSDEGNYSEATTTRQAYDLLAEGFGPGFNGPFLAVAEVDGEASTQQFAAVADAIAATDGVTSVTPPIPDDPDSPSAMLVRVIPATSPQDAATEDLVHLLRDEVVPAASGDGLDVYLTGTVPANIDFTSYLSGRIILFFCAVLTLSFLLLMMVFRSIVIPIKAVLMNVLSIAAAYGLVVAIFQWGWFSDVFGVTAGAPIEPFIPMMLFAIVFGLSMDYEVFLLSRIKEEYDRSGDAVNSVADGLASTARVISAAAAIMVVVFGSFMFEDDRIVKLFGLGLSMAVLLDATLVRMLLVPATMELLGERNWWLPGWLDRILPVLHVEGSAVDGAVGAHPDAEKVPAPV